MPIHCCRKNYGLRSFYSYIFDCDSVVFVGENSHFLLSALVKHLDNKNVIDQPLIQTDIVNITMQLGQNAKKEATVAITGSIFDLIKHLRKCLQNSDELGISGHCADNRKIILQLALEKCIFQLSNKVYSLFSFVAYRITHVVGFETYKPC